MLMKKVIIILAIFFSSCSNDFDSNITIPSNINSFKFESTGSLDSSNKILSITENDTTYSIQLHANEYSLIEFEDIDSGERFIVLEDNRKEINSIAVSPQLVDSGLPKSVFMLKEENGNLSLELPFELVFGKDTLNLDANSIDLNNENGVLKFHN